MNIITKGLGSNLLITQGFGSQTVIPPVVPVEEQGGGAMSKALWKKRRRPYKLETRTKIIKRYPVHGSIIRRIYKNFDIFGLGLSRLNTVLNGFGASKSLSKNEFISFGSICEPIISNFNLYSKLKTFNKVDLKLDGQKLARINPKHIEVFGSKLSNESNEIFSKGTLKDKLLIEKQVISKVNDNKLKLLLLDI